MGRQLELSLPQRGGRRPGAGRPRTRAHPGLAGPGVSHLTRAALSRHHPVHVTQRVQPGVGHLRSQSRAAIIKDALQSVRGRMRVVHYSIQGNHLHLIVEAGSAQDLSRGMQALAIRVAKRLNRLAARTGAVFVDRYHSHALATRREVAHAVRYVLGNYRHHARGPLPSRWRDPLSSAGAPMAAPRTWLLRVGWKLEPPRRQVAGSPMSNSILGTRPQGTR